MNAKFTAVACCFALSLFMLSACSDDEETQGSSSTSAPSATSDGTSPNTSETSTPTSTTQTTTPDVGEDVSESDTSEDAFLDDIVEPDATDDVSEPDVIDDVSEPDVIDDVSEPDVIDDVSEPDVLDDASEPDATNDTSEPSVCEEDCEETNTLIDFDGTERNFTLAYFGLSAPTGPGAPPTLYIEMYTGVDPGCPSEDSPAPAATLILSSFALPDETPFPYLDEDATLTLVDFEGALIPGVPPFSTASSVSLSVQGAEVCVSCVGSPAPSQSGSYVTFDLSATFEQGTGQGHVYATHCDSLDENF